MNYLIIEDKFANKNNKKRIKNNFFSYKNYF